jgi:serine phosphatase RsbU (regulator of sigma subunit)
MNDEGDLLDDGSGRFRHSSEPEMLTLNQLADSLVGVESSRLLLARIEENLARLAALPARLYLIDSGAMVFYPVAAFSCSDRHDEIAAEDILLEPKPHHYLLLQQGDPVGLLVVEREDGYPEAILEQMAVLLGPALMGVNQHEITLGELQQVHQQMNRLTAAGRLLKHLDIEILLTEIMQCVLETVRADVGCLMVVEDGSDSDLRPAVTWGLQEEHVDAIRFTDGQRLVDRVLGAEEPLRMRKKKVASDLDLSGLQANLTGILALPLRSSEHRHGVVLLANPERDFSKEDARLLSVVCDMAATALDNARLVAATVEQERMQHDFSTARTVQANMLPKGGIEVGGRLSAVGYSQPSEETGGDYFTYLERDGRLLSLIGDVTGHGLGAALFTTVAHAMVQFTLRSETGLSRSLEVLNEGLYHTKSGRFMTSAVVEVDPETLGFRYASAGHNPLCWIHDGEVRWLDSTGMPLGILMEISAEEAEPLVLSPGDLVFLYTDGITEAAGPAEDDGWWGEEGMSDSLLRHHQAGLTGQALIDALLADLDGYTGGGRLADDVTMVAINVAGSQ